MFVFNGIEFVEEVSLFYFFLFLVVVLVIEEMVDVVKVLCFGIKDFLFKLIINYLYFVSVIEKVLVNDDY